MTIKIEVFSDYVCPYCFLAKRPLEEVARDEGVEIEWMPFELRPYPADTLRPEDDYLPRVWEGSVYPLAKSLGISIQLPSISPQPYTHLAFEGYQFAKERGKATAYNERVLEAFFQEDKDIGRVDVLSQLAKEIGLSADEFGSALSERKYKSIHQEALIYAYRQKISSVPAFVVNGEALMAGMPDKESLQRAIKTAKSRDPS